MEKCWKIKEILPIKVKVTKSWTGRSYTINVPPMVMKYETFQKLGDNLKLDEKTWNFRIRAGYNPLREVILKKYQNDVHSFQYDCSNGACQFTASTKQDVDNWLKLYEDYVVRGT